MQILTFHHSIRLTSVKHHFVHITSAYPHPNSRSHSHTQQNNSEMRKINFYKIYASVLICKILFFIWMKFFHNLMFKVNQHFLFEGFLPAPFQQSVHSKKLSAATATNPTVSFALQQSAQQKHLYPILLLRLRVWVEMPSSRPHAMPAVCRVHRVECRSRW